MIKNSTVVVTGGGRGIGQTISLAFAEAGANVAIIYSGTEPTQTLEQMATNGVTATAYRCDVSDFAATKSTVEQIIKDFGAVEVLVNNAGITKDTLLMRMSEQQWDDVLDVNLKGCFNMIKHLTPYMMRARRGAIINMSSVVGLMGNAGQVNYSASKAGLIGLTKSVARELSSRGITCNAIAPGFIDTAMTAALTEQQKEMLVKNIPLGRVGSPIDVANAVLFLANNRYITGEVIKVDGGLYI